MKYLISKQALTLAAAILSLSATANTTSVQNDYGHGAISKGFSGKYSAGKSLAPVNAGENDAVLFFEGFEGGNDGDVTWLPTGWERLSKGAPGLADVNKWYNSPTTSTSTDLLPAGSEGKRFEAIVASSDKEQDEWLITPEMTVREGDILSFKTYFLPFYFFYTDSKHYDWQNGKWIKQEICQDLKLYVKEGEGDFTLLHSFAEDYMGVDYNTLMTDDLGGKMKDFQFPLTNYAGKAVRFAFQYVGIDGNAVFVDAVRVGLPETTPKYLPPFSTLYYGTQLGGSYGLAPQSIAVFPVNAPVTFMNYSDYIEGQSFDWSAQNADCETTDTKDPNEFAVTYKPKYSEDGTFVPSENWHAAPQLTMSAPGYAPATYTWDIHAMQTGGNASYAIAGGNANFGLLQANPNLDFDFPTEYIDFGKPSMPLFGYDSDSKEWWTNHTIGEEAGPDDYAIVKGVLNFIYPSTSPLVINGVTAMAYGNVDADLELKMEFFVINEDYTPAERPFASATITGNDIIGRDPEINNMLVLPFRFETPVVIDDSETAYIVKLSGFDSEKVTYFAPYQSWKPMDVCLSFIEEEVAYNGQKDVTFVPTANFKNEDGDELMSAFCFNLDGYFPWLTADLAEIDLGTSLSGIISLDSFNDGADYKVEAPEWLSATVTGRYNSAKLNLTATATETPRDGNVTISAPGVSKTFKVHQGVTDTTGISDITPDDNSISEIYTIDGKPVNTGELAPGIYIVRRNDGSTSKIMIR